MKKLLYLLIFSIFIFTSCRNETKTRNDINSNTETVNPVQTNDCMDSDLYKCICSYVQTSGVFFIECFPQYINLYFFSNDTIDYFTIWRDFSLPYYLDVDSTLDFFHLKIDLTVCSAFLKNIDNCYLFLIKTIDYNTDLYASCLYLPDNRMIQDTVMYNDGRLFIQTYKYHKVGNNFNIEKLEKPIVDFLGNLPERFW